MKKMSIYRFRFSFSRLPSPTKGVYHCTEPVSLEPDWGIAVRVSQEAESDGSGETGPKVAKLARARNGVTVVVATEGGSPVGSQGGSDVSTPPLLLPLQSGDAYFLLDDFKWVMGDAAVYVLSTDTLGAFRFSRKVTY